jgi:hypothetical protein
VAAYIQGEFDFDITPTPAKTPPPDDRPPSPDAAGPGIYDVVGRSVSFSKKGTLTKRGWQKLYALLSIYRDKRYETFRYLLVNDKGYIKDHVAVTAFHPSRTPISPNLIGSDYFTYQIKKQAGQMNCFVIAVHNHPSGNIEPSGEDIAVNDYLKKTFGNIYGGHIILDHGEFSFCAADASTFSRADITPRPPSDQTPREPRDDYTGFQIRNQTHEAFLRAAIQVDSGDKWNSADWVPILFLSQSHRIQSLHYYHVSEFAAQNADVNILNKSILIARSAGSTAMYALPTSDSMFDLIKDFSDKIPLFMDAVYNGRSLHLESGNTKNLVNFFPAQADYSSTFSITPGFNSQDDPAPSGDVEAAAGTPPEQRSQNGNLELRAPRAGYDIKVTPRDVEKWAKDELPQVHEKYALLQYRLPAAKKEAERASIEKRLDSLRSGLVSYYKIFHLRQFDKEEYRRNIDIIRNAKNPKDFPPGFIHVGFLPQIYHDLGYLSSPLFISPRLLYLIMNDGGFIKSPNAQYRNLPEKFINSLQSFIGDPQLIPDARSDNLAAVAFVNAADDDNKPIAVYTSPIGVIYDPAANANVSSSLILSASGIKNTKLIALSENIEDALLYIKKEAESVPPVLRASLIRKTQTSGDPAITPAPGDLMFSFLESNIARYKQAVGGYPHNFNFLHESEAPYAVPEHTPPDKEFLMADKSESISLHFSRESVEYLDRLRSIRDPQNRRAFHDAFTQIDDFSRLKTLPDFARLEDQYREYFSAFIARFPDAPPPSSPPRLTSLPLPEQTPWDFLLRASRLSSPEEYRAYYNDNVNSFTPGDIKTVSDGTLAVFRDGNALPLAFAAAAPPYDSALYKQADEHGVALRGLIPTPDDVDRYGATVVRDKTFSYAQLLNNDYFAQTSRDNRRTQLEYLETLLRTEPAQRGAVHRFYSRLAEFKSLSSFPRFDRLEEQYRERLSAYRADFPDDAQPFHNDKKLIGLSQPAVSYTPLQFLQDASKLTSPEDYRAFYDRRYGDGLPVAHVRMVSPDDVALFLAPQKLPAALKPYKPDNYAELYKLAVHNGFVPLQDKKPVIPSPDEAAANGIGLIAERLRDLENLLSGRSHTQRLSRVNSPPTPKAPADPAALFAAFVNNPFSPGAAVPPFGVSRNGTLKLMEGYSFLKTEDSGHTVRLSKRDERGLPKTIGISRTHYDFIVDAANAPASSKEPAPEIIKKYERTVLADVDKTRPNTAANFWHNYRVLARREALNPQDAAATARRIYGEMPLDEKDKFSKSLASYAKLRSEPYNDRILRYYDQTVKDVPLKNRSPHSGEALRTLRHDDDTVDAKGKQIDNRLTLKIGDPVKLNLKLPDLITGVPKQVLKTDLYLASSSEKLNKVVVMSSDNTSKYVLSRDSFIKNMALIEQRREKRRRTEEKKECRASLRESVGVDW